MEIAIIGAGRMGSTLAELFVDGGHRVLLVNSRGPESLAALAGLGPSEGKIVVDTTNNRIGPRPEDVFELGEPTSSEVVADLVPRARVVKAFNHQPIPALRQELGLPAVSAMPCSSPATTPMPKPWSAR